MAKGATIPTRVTADVAAAATSVAQAENRTTTEQINYRLRIGMQVERPLRRRTARSSLWLRAMLSSPP